MTKNQNKIEIRKKGDYLEAETATQVYVSKKEKEENIRKLQDLLGKQKGLIKNKEKIRPFKNNVLFYIRKDRKIEIYDGIKEGTFKVENSDKKETKYEFNTRDICRLEWAGETVYCYIQYEEEIMPYPRDPWVIAHIIETTVDKILTDMSKWKLEEEKLKLGKIWAFVGLAAVVIGGYILYKMLVKPQVTPQTIQNVTNATTMIIQSTAK